jgi:YfiR/HmsC-like
VPTPKSTGNFKRALHDEAKADPSLMNGKASIWLQVKPRMYRLVVCPFVLFAMVVRAPGPPTALAQSKADEYHVKAAFLFHFAQLVEWPDAPDESGSSLLLCTLGDDPFHGELESTVEGKQIGSRVLRIRHLSEAKVTRGCNMVFISRSENRHLAAILASLRNSPILTVGEADDFLTSGGIIRLCLEGNKVRFEINREAAESARLRISSTLLLLARKVVE